MTGSTLLHALLAAVLSALVSSFVAAEQVALDLPALVKKVRPAVMLITTYDGDGRQISSGTGFVVRSDGVVVTNCHVIAKGAKILAKADNGGLFQVAGVLVLDLSDDIVLLKLEGKDLPTLTLGNSLNVEAGIRIAVIGSPFGLEGTLSDGIVSAVREASRSGQRWIQMTAAISPGSSGSPVLNEKCEVIAVATATIREGQSLNLAVPVEVVKKALAESAKAGGLSPIENKKQNEERGMSDDPELAGALSEDPVSNLTHAKALVLRHPDNPEAYSLLGLSYACLGLEKESIDAYTELTKRWPDAPNSWASLASIYSGFKRYDEAIPAYKRAIGLDPLGKSAFLEWCLLGEAYSEAKKYDDAIPAFKEALKLSPDFGRAWGKLGAVYAELKKYDDAIAALNKSIKISPLYAEGWRDLSRTYFLIGQKEKAFQALEGLRKLDPAMAEELRKSLT